MERNEHSAKRIVKARCAILTISDSRSLENDQSGASIRSLLEENGHSVIDHRIIKNDPSAVREEIARFLDSDLDLMITTGGTGIGRRDFTIETMEPLLEKGLNGFGELFRYLSFQEIGPRALMSRAFGGVARGKLLFALPGSPHAVKLGLKELILPELGHLLWEANR